MIPKEVWGGNCMYCMYSTGNYIQDIVTTYNGKKSEKVYIYIYMNHFAVESL